MPTPVVPTRRYQLESLLGEGGMGKVYRAWDRSASREVALKCLLETSAESERKRFREEVRVLTRLHHPNLIRIYDFHPETSEVVDGFTESSPCFTMELLPFPSLAESKAKVSATEFSKLLFQILQGLHCLHRRGLVHRDLKPSNIVVTDQRIVKLLDFGLAGMRESLIASELPMGTLAYQAPETFWGSYSEAADLFSLGVLSYEILTKTLPYSQALSNLSTTLPPASIALLRPDLPDHLADLISRFLQLKVEDRPSSADAALRFLRRHLPSSEKSEESPAIPWALERPPWVGRSSELTQLRSFWEETKQLGRPQGLRLSGPTGVGRSRLLEECNWKLRLEGAEVLSIGPLQAGRWLASWGDSYEAIVASLKVAKDGPRWIQFTDLQEWPSQHLRELQIFLSLLENLPRPWACLLEWNEELLNPEGHSALQNLSGAMSWRNLRLEDLSAADTLALLQAATLEEPIAANLAESVASQSGGRPLLVLELLRELYLQKSGKNAGDPEFSANLREAIRAKLSRLGEEEGRLLGLMLVRNEPSTLEAIETMTGWEAEKTWALAKDLEAEDWIQGQANTGSWSLRHPSLRPVAIQEISAELIRSAHRDWIIFDRSREPEAKPGPTALRLAHHALAIDDAATAKKYGFAAAGFCQTKGDEARAIAIYEKMLPFAETAAERYLIQANLAPAYYRQSQFEKSLRAYDLWFSDREDDPSQLQKLKHRFYTGLVFSGWGKRREAEQRLAEALEIGDGKKFPAHSPYLVRTHNLLAALAEKNKAPGKSLLHLRQAAELAAGQPLAEAEIAQRLGRWHQDRLDWNAAEEHFQKSRAAFAKAGNPQGEAIAWNSLAMLHLSEGRLREAWDEIGEARRISGSGRDFLQQTRYQENAGLIAMSRGEYAQAEEIFAASQKLLSWLGQESDRLLVALHRLQLALCLGNSDQGQHWIQFLETRQEDLDEQELGAEFQLVLADNELRAGQESSAKTRIEGLLQKKMDIAPYDRLRAELALWRSHWQAREQSGAEPIFKDPPLLSSLPGPNFACWLALRDFLNIPGATSTESSLYGVLRRVQACENPELRLEIYQHLTRHFKWNHLQRLSEKMREAAQLEWNALFNSLTEEMRMDFEKNRNLSQLEETLQSLLPQAKTSAPPAATASSDSGGIQVSEARFRQFSEINRQIAEKTDLKELLERVMDAAVEFTGAERGFLLLKKPNSVKDSLQDFEIQAARHLKQSKLGTEEFSLSMTAVRQAVESGTYLLTDNARLDPRFQEKKSVVLHQLTSILVVPLEHSGKIHGAIYLDHRLQPGCFKNEDILLLNAFASQAALVIQKTRLLEELQQANAKLSGEVRDQAQHIQILTGELIQARGNLRYEYTDIIGQSPQMMQVFQLLDHVTATSIPVWIWGESGTGKELVARSLHENSPRKKGPFVSENCSALPENLLESELFGHKRGAFTHADRDRIGLLEQASGGTLFLDEVADMSLGMQAKLLRAFQEGEIRPLGSSKKVKIDVRLVTASNRDLAEMVREEEFRQDLFFRINGLTIRLPPLRERKADIPLLVDFFIKKLGQQFGFPECEVTESAYQTLLQYAWPGNIRELESVIRNAMLFARGKAIGPEFLTLNLSLASKKSTGDPMDLGSEIRGGPQKEKVLNLLRTHRLDKEKVAEALGISLRSLYTWLEKMGIPKKKSQLANYLEGRA